MAYIFGSIWDRFNRNALNDLSKSVEQQGVSIQDLVAEGQLTPSQYAQLVSIVNGNIKKGNVTVDDIDINHGKIEQRHISDSLLQIMAGNAPVNAVPADGSITTIKMANSAATYDKRTRLGDAAQLVSFTSPINFDLVNNKLQLPKSSHVFTGSRWISLVSASETAVDYEMNLDVNSIYNIYFNAKSTSGSLDFVFRLARADNSDLQDYVLLGAVSRFGAGFAYINGNFTVNGESGGISDNSITTEKIAPDAVDYDKRTKLGNSGFLVSFTSPINFDLARNQINIPKSSHVFTAGRWIRLVAASGTPIDYDMGIDSVSIYNIYFNAKSENDSLDFVFRKFNANNSDLQDYILLGVIARGANGFVHVNGNFTVNGEVALPNKSITKDKLADNVFDNIEGGGNSGKYHYYDELTGKYVTPINLEVDREELDATTPDDIYAYYDVLMAEYPNNITRRTIGYSQKADGSADSTLPIYEYHYKPYRGDANTSVRIPRIMIQAGIHGYEKLCVLATYKWFEQMLTGGDEVSDFMKYNIDFHIVPVANPYAYLHNIRHNVNGVDINTNFEMDWYKKNNDGSAGSLYGGEEPMSEMETQVLDAWYSEFEGDTIGFIDMHNTGVRITSKGSYGYCWFISGDEGIRTMSLNLLNSISRKWRNDFPDLAAEPEDVVFGDVSERTDGTARNQALKKYNILSLSLDPSWNLKLSSGSWKYSPEALHTNIDVLGASVLSFVKNFGK